MFEVPFERIHTPTPTVRSSTNTSTDSPGSKLKKIRVEMGHFVFGGKTQRIEMGNKNHTQTNDEDTTSYNTPADITRYNIYGVPSQPPN